jgi:hypothetical protein
MAAASGGIALRWRPPGEGEAPLFPGQWVTTTSLIAPSGSSAPGTLTHPEVALKELLDIDPTRAQADVEADILNYATKWGWLGKPGSLWVVDFTQAWHDLDFRDGVATLPADARITERVAEYDREDLAEWLRTIAELRELDLVAQACKQLREHPRNLTRRDLILGYFTTDVRDPEWVCCRFPQTPLRVDGRLLMEADPVGRPMSLHTVRELPPIELAELGREVVRETLRRRLRGAASGGLDADGGRLNERWAPTTLVSSFADSLYRRAASATARHVRRCEGCETDFVPRRPDHVFCDENCRARTYHRSVRARASAS